MKTISMDIGGTFIKWAILDEELNIIEKGKFLSKAFEVKTVGILKKVSNKVNDLKAKYIDVDGVGVSIAGVVDSKTGKVIVGTLNLPESQGKNIQNLIESEVNLPVRIINDANAATLGEATVGELKGESDGVLITIGTGIGGGLIINGEIYEGKHLSAGEIGRHYVGGRKWEEKNSVRTLINRITLAFDLENIDGEKILSMIDENKMINEIYLDWLQGIAEGISNIINILNPGTVVIGGGISENPKFNIDQIKEMISKYVAKEILIQTNILKSSTGNDAALYGAAKFLKKQIKKEGEKN